MKQAFLSRKTDIIFVALFSLLFAAEFREFLFTKSVLFERDMTMIEVPARQLTVRLLKEGNFALWTDAYGNGQPFLANPKNAILYPTTWLYLILPFFTAFKFHYIIHVLFGWLGLYVLCQSYSLSKQAAFFGASLFVFSGMYLSSFEFYNHIAAIAWMPWILFLLNGRLRPGRARFVLLAFLWAFMILAGAPEILLITLVLAAAQAFFRPGEWKMRLRTTILPLILASFLAAAQLLPSFEMLRQTGREAQPAYWPLELIQLFEMPFPHVLGNDRGPGRTEFWGWHVFDKHNPLYYSLYIGAGALVFLLIGLKRPLERRRKILLLCLFVLFLLACGRYSPFFFLYRLTPVLSAIRYPVKFFLGSVFCLSILAAAGVDALRDVLDRSRRAATGFAAAAGTVLLLFIAFRRPILDILNKFLIIEKEVSLAALGRSIGTGLGLLAVFGAALLVLSRTKGWGRLPAWLLIALAIADPVHHNRYINPTVPDSFYNRPSILSDFKTPLTVYRPDNFFIGLREKMADNERFLKYCRECLYPFTGLGDGVRYAFNVDFYGTYHHHFMELMKAVLNLPLPDQRKILRYLGCELCIGDTPTFSAEAARKIRIEGFAVYIEKIAPGRALPYVTYDTVRAAAPADRLNIFISREFDPKERVVTENGVMFREPDVTIPDKVETFSPVLIEEESAGAGRFSLSIDRQGVAVFPGNFAPGWKAWVDGRKAEVFEANLFAKGVVISPGRHEIVLRYLPASFIWGTAISLAAIALTLIGLVAGTIRVKRRARPGSP